MKGRDYLWCLVHTLLDREDELERFCPRVQEPGSGGALPCVRPAGLQLGGGERKHLL